MKDVQKRYQELELTVYRRDLREIVAALLAIGMFAAFWPIYRSSPVAIAGVAIIMLGGLVIIYVLLRAQKPSSLPFDVSVVEYCRGRLAWLERQIRLMQTVAWWYMAPMAGGSLLFEWGLAGRSAPAFGVAALVTLAVSIIIIYLNKYAVRQSLQPVRDELRA